MCRFLVEAGAPVDAPDLWGNTPLMLAASKGHMMTCQQLLDLGAFRHARNYRGTSAAGFAARHGRLKALTLLLDDLDSNYLRPGERGSTIVTVLPDGREKRHPRVEVDPFAPPLPELKLKAEDLDWFVICSFH